MHSGCRSKPPLKGILGSPTNLVCLFSLPLFLLLTLLILLNFPTLLTLLTLLTLRTLLTLLILLTLFSWWLAKTLADVPNHTGPKLPVVLELGAGNGVLSRHLQHRLRGGASVVACDDNTNKVPCVFFVFT
jgi:hypothetical protein